VPLPSLIVLLIQIVPHTLKTIALGVAIGFGFPPLIVGTPSADFTSEEKFAFLRHGFRILCYVFAGIMTLNLATTAFCGFRNLLPSSNNSATVAAVAAAAAMNVATLLAAFGGGNNNLQH